MSFAAAGVGLVFMIEIVLPDHTIRYCDGGEFEHEGHIWSSVDERYGTIASFDPAQSGLADEAPTMTLEWQSSSPVADIALSNPTFQKSRVRVIVATYNAETGLILTAKNKFIGLFNFTLLEVGSNSRALTIHVATEFDRLLNTDKGNRANNAFQRFVFGERGLEFTTGVEDKLNWGGGE